MNDCKRYEYVDINHFIGPKTRRNKVDVMVFEYFTTQVAWGIWQANKKHCLLFQRATDPDLRLL